MVALSELQLENFRSHQRRHFPLGQLTVLAGPNGAGKTNVLEALWMLATSRSFQAVRESDIIHWGADVARAVAGDYELVLLRRPEPSKILKLRGAIKRPIDYLGELRAVLFTPDSFIVFSGSPADRRRFLDTLLAQRDKGAARLLLRYRRILRQRNRLLRQISEGRSAPAALAVWNEQLAPAALAIRAARERLVDELLPLARERHQAMGRSRTGSLDLIYRSVTPATEAVFYEKLVEYLPRELSQQATLVGPHRDDLEIRLDGRSVQQHASRGELRRLLLALKWAETHLLSQDGRPVLLLLDDVFSELDVAHRAALWPLMTVTQTVVTMTDAAQIPSDLPSAPTVVTLAAAGEGA